MDPDANLKEQLDLARSIQKSQDMVEASMDALRLAELVEALDEWVRRGGFLPERWRTGR